MKKELLFLITITTYFHSASCPFEFSLEDPRPFFEQYEIEQKENIVSQDSQVIKE